MNDNSDFGQNVDKSQVPPIEQKRMVAFINHFIVNTVSFLNEFLANVESKFVEFESKLQNIEASLQIVEAKMASIPDVDGGGQPKPSTEKQIETPVQEPQTKIEEPSTTNQNQNEIQTDEIELEPNHDELDTKTGVKACDDARYRKYFKMMQFGVPAPAVKLKMTAEGFDPNVLDNPNRILEDGIKHEAMEDV